ncbi:MAG TPA: protein kinase [Polyangia bacterium]|nr:protein kinase [Polyangia bacterium]
MTALLQAGAYAEAARALRRLGDLERAQALYEKVWDFATAAEVAAERGDRPELLRLLLEAKDLPRAAQLGQEIQSGTALEQERAARVYEQKRMWPEAAALWEAVGAREHARELYRRGQLPLEAARLEEALGRVREAGLIYERFLAEQPASPEAPRAALALGRILSGFGRHEEAARYLQRALRQVSSAVGEGETPGEPGGEEDRERGAAPPGPGPTLARLLRDLRRQLVVELAALGYGFAARRQLDEMRREEPSLPALEAFLAAEQARLAAARPPGQPEGGDQGQEGTEELLGGRYLVRRLLGSGGMGRVYHARDRMAERDVAVKVVAPPIDAAAQASFQRFLREARVVSSLRHPHIVTVLDFHEHLGLLVMEYMAGGTVADRLQVGPEPGARPASSPSSVRAILGQVISGLQAAHAHGVIHRDIKPANIFLTASGEAKLGDFGVAHLQDLGATQTGGFIGTLAYMSPEQITGAPLSFACDIYALGVTAFQMLTGQLPLPGPDFIGQHLSATPRTVSSLRPDLAAFDPVIARMLAKDPGDRYATLDELAQALAAVPLGVEGGVYAGRASSAGAGATSGSGPEEVHEAGGERYRVEALIGRTAVSTLERGIDQRLGRAVIVERFIEGYWQGEEGARHLGWLRTMARHGGPHLQRVLRIEAQAGRVIYEAPLGPPPVRPLAPPAAARLVWGLVQALAGPHGEGVAHGDLRSDAVVLEESGPTLLVAGHGPSLRGVHEDLADLGVLLRELVPGVALPGEAGLADWAAWAQGQLGQVPRTQ